MAAAIQRTEMFIIGLLFIVSVITPLLSTSLLITLDMLVVRVSIIVLLMWLTSYGPLVSFLALMAVGLLYIERNRRKMIHVQEMGPIYSTNQKSRPATIKEAPTSQKTVPVQPFQSPDEEDDDVYSWYVPIEEDTSTTVFEPVAPSINQKQVLDSVPHRTL